MGDETTGDGQQLHNSSGDGPRTPAPVCCYDFRAIHKRQPLIVVRGFYLEPRKEAKETEFSNNLLVHTPYIN